MSEPYPNAARRRSGVVVPERPRLAGRAAAFLLWALIQGVDRTLQYRLDDRSERYLTGRPERAIFAIWHNRLALSLRIYQRFISLDQPQRRMAAMVSASRDGGILAQILEQFRVQPVRGSTSRRGPQATLEMISWAERGLDLAITPDGPRGPRYVAQPGVIDVAAVSGLPIVPVSYDLSRRIEVRSWDRFLVPLPLAQCVTRFGPPLRVPRGISDEEREAHRLELQSRLLAITDLPVSGTGQSSR